MFRAIPVLLILLSAPASSLATAQQKTGADALRGEPLTVATRQVPPFAMRDAAGNWRGIAIDLWSGVAEQLGVDYRYTEMGLTQMLEAVADGRVDAAVAALTITSEREKRVDFSHPYHTSGLGIAVQQNPGGGAMATICGGPPSRMICGSSLSLPSGPTRLSTAEPMPWPFWVSAWTVQCPSGRTSNR